MSIVKSQIALCMQYTVEELLGDDRNHINACDLSLPSEITTSSETLRRVSLSSCTCFSPTCWGLPCRHILRVYLHKNITIISSLWLVKGERQRDNLVNELINTNRRVPEHNVSHILQTKDERYALLCNDFKNVARIASLTSENAQKVRKELMKISRLLQYNELDIVAPRIMTTNQEIIIQNPKISLSKGRPSQKRKKCADEFPKRRRKRK